MAYTIEVARSLLSGPLADRPMASVGRYWYFADDEDGGTLYKSDGATWRQVSGAVSGGAGATFGTPAIVLGTAAANGSVDEAIRRDSTIVAFDATAPTTQAFGDSAAAGSAAVAARRDHKHAMPSLGTGSTNACAGNDPRLSDARTPTAHVHSGADITSGTVGESFIDAAVARDSEVTSAISALSSVYQPLDSDLTAVAGLSPTNDDIVQRKAGAWTNRTMAQLIADLAALGTTFQPLDSDLTSIAALATTSFGRALLTEASASSARTTLGVPTAVGGVEWTVVTKAIDESNASNTSVQADDELLFTATSGAVYQILALIVYASPAGGGTPDIKIGMGEDATVRGSGHGMGIGTGDTVSSFTAAACNQVGNWSFGTAAADRLAVMRATYTGNGGTFSILWSQVTSGTNATIVRANSRLAYRRLN